MGERPSVLHFPQQPVEFVMTEVFGQLGRT
jgi:hypothetical protein